MNKDLDNTKPACYAPWVTTYEYTNGDITPCCEWSRTSPKSDDYIIHSKKHLSFEDRFNHSNSQALRKMMMEVPVTNIPGCIHCVNNERSGVYSHRQYLNELVEDRQPIDLNKFMLVHMDYRESNLCNFSCKMCGHDLSSTHAVIKNWIDGDNKEFPKNGVRKNQHHLQMYLDRLDEVKIIHFLGGEPMLMDSMYIILEEIKKRNIGNNIVVRITTNGSLLHREKDNLFEYLEGIKYKEFFISIDAIGDQHNYWRHKGTWDTVWKNTLEINKYVKENKRNTGIGIRTALSWPTAYAAKEAFDLMKDKGIDHGTTLVMDPEGLRISQLPQHHLDALVEHWKEYPEMQTVFLNTKSRTNWVELREQKLTMMQHDAWHKNSFVDAFPEFADFYDKIP
jgi:MoaA/NifB/PqqE/SkfB family radical SAM enzyme